MRNIRLILEYEGTRYAGWQTQRGLPSIQGALTEAVKAITGEDAKIIGASRTDARVHAFAQTANFKTRSTMSVQSLMRGLNAKLPEDIVVKEAAEAADGFDSRRDSKGKTYTYKILNRQCPSAFLRRYAWFVPHRLDADKMREASGHFIGEKDFSSFMAADSDALHSIREVRSVEVLENHGGLMEITVNGTAFLRHMIRIMAGTLVAVGKGKLKPEDISCIIEERDRTKASATAPAEGLTLMKVEY